MNEFCCLGGKAKCRRLPVELIFYFTSRECQLVFYWSKLLNWFRTQNKTIVLANHSETISKINQSKLKSNMRTRLQALEMPQAIDDRSMILCVCFFFFYDFVFLLLIG